MCTLGNLLPTAAAAALTDRPARQTDLSYSLVSGASSDLSARWLREPVQFNANSAVDSKNRVGFMTATKAPQRRRHAGNRMAE